MIDINLSVSFAAWVILENKNIINNNKVSVK